MYHRFYRFLVLATLFFALTACVSVPKAPDSEHLAVAKRFLRSIDAGEWVLLSIQRKIDEDSKEQPGMTELARRVFADLTADEIENVASDIYARHITQEHLLELAQFAETQTGKRFFKIGFDRAFNDTPQSPEEVMRQFNADEIVEIIRFGQSDAAAEMKQELPAINQELSQTARELGEKKMKEYLEHH